ncbi:MAG: hypothetical protein R3C17_22165 [Planctomycetaceae bacterium]
MSRHRWHGACLVVRDGVYREGDAHGGTRVSGRDHRQGLALQVWASTSGNRALEKEKSPIEPLIVCGMQGVPACSIS